MEEAIRYILSRMERGETDVEKLKMESAQKFKLRGPPKSSQIMRYANEYMLSEEAIRNLKRKPVRTISGVSPIAVMIKPEKSCKWKCIYCPYTGKAAKSYTGEEPSALRARDAGFDPYVQTKNRIRQYELIGHPHQKCEIIIMGGTFLATEVGYQRWFVKRIYDALNGYESKSLEEAKKTNETAENRAVGLTVETRPDVCSEEDVKRVLEFGGTRVELGVQNPDDRVYERIERGHTEKEVYEATKRLKESAFKICYHLMPGLPGSNKSKDRMMIERVFSDERMRPDMLKIYPTLVIGGTKLMEMWRSGEYSPLSSDEAAEIIAEWMEKIPPYVRVMRVQRDIPSNLIEGGTKKSNLRQMVEEKMKESGKMTLEIRSREMGFKKRNADRLRTNIIVYRASGGTEVFAEKVDGEYHLAGFCRMRIERDGWALVRELHVYGREARLGEIGSVQHRGVGRELLEKCESIAVSEYGADKMSIISGVGVREYYRKLGYRLRGHYMQKKLSRA